MKYEVVVIGTSAGGLAALTDILVPLPADYSLPIVIVQHRSKNERDLLEQILQAKCKIKVKQADEKEKIVMGIVYFAPPNYHLLIEKDYTFSLSNDALVNFSRPSIDVLFQTAADAYKDKLIGIILTGASKDGAQGIKTIKNKKGMTIAQNPENAEYPSMPKEAIATNCVEQILEIKKIKDFLLNIQGELKND